MNIAEVIAWKFNSQPGMCCKEIDGVVQIIEFPGGIPTQADQDQWTVEYIASGNGSAVLKEQQADITKVDPFLKALVLALNDGSFIPGSSYTNQQIKTIIKSKL